MRRDQQEQMINELVQSLYKTSETVFRPRHPWVLVRMLPREQKVGSIILPDIDMNKVVHEALVVRTWETRTDERGVLRKSEVQPGDHVLFPHWAGVPVARVGGSLPTEDTYRLVRENYDDNQGGIYGVVEYGDVKEGVRNTLQRIIERFVSTMDSDEAVAAIMLRFLLLDRQTQSRTLSGQ